MYYLCGYIIQTRKMKYLLRSNSNAKLTLLLVISKYLTIKIFIIMEKRKISLIELYKEKQKELTPANQLIKKIQDVTGRSTIAIRLWLSGKSKPEPLVARIVAEALGIDPDYIFPDNNGNNGNN